MRGGNCLLDLTLSNPTRNIAVMAHVQLRNQRTNQRVLPVYYSENYVSLLPGESRTIAIEAASTGSRRRAASGGGGRLERHGQGDGFPGRGRRSNRHQRQCSRVARTGAKLIDPERAAGDAAERAQLPERPLTCFCPARDNEHRHRAATVRIVPTRP